MEVVTWITNHFLLVSSTIFFLGVMYLWQRYLRWTQGTAPFSATVAFGKGNRDGLFSGRKQFGPIFTLNLLAKKLTVVTNPKEINTVANEPETKLSITATANMMIKHML